MILREHPLDIAVAETLGYERAFDSILGEVWKSPRGDILDQLPAFSQDLETAKELIDYLQGQGLLVAFTEALAEELGLPPTTALDTLLSSNTPKLTEMFCEVALQVNEA